MSRSYKKHKIYKMLDKEYAKFYNRKLRRMKDFDVSGKAFRKIGSMYDVCEGVIRYTDEEVKNDKTVRKVLKK